MLGGRLFCFLAGMIVGAWVMQRLRKQIKQKTSFQHQVSNRIKNLTKEVREAIAEGRKSTSDMSEAYDGQNGYR